ncbi:5632_t:CDS:2, partial [Acaulospora morrowiae]
GPSENPFEARGKFLRKSSSVSDSIIRLNKSSYFSVSTAKDYGFARAKPRKVSTVNIGRRLLAWESEKRRQNETLIKSFDSEEIDIHIDGSTIKRAMGITPYECAKSIAQELADSSIVAL